MFAFNEFQIIDEHCAMKVGTDGVLLGAWTDLYLCPGNAGRERYVLDIGAGSGVVSLLLAQRYHAARIEAIECDEDAFIDLTCNITNSRYAGRINAINVDFQQFRPLRKVDLIVSNPPFFTESLRSPVAARSLARHADILSPFTLIDYAREHLAGNGMLAMITPAMLEDEITYSAEMSHLKVRRLTRVKTREGRIAERILWQFARQDGHLDDKTVTIRSAENEWTREYRDLVGPYYHHIPDS